VLARDARSRGLWRPAEVVARLASTAAAAAAIDLTAPTKHRYEVIFSSDGKTAALDAQHLEPLPVSDDDNSDDDGGYGSAGGGA